MRSRSCMASRLSPMGRRSPCATTRAICSDGLALSQIVKQEVSNWSNVAGSVGNAAAGRKHKLVIVIHQPFQRSLFITSIGGLSIEGKNLRHGRTRGLLNDVSQLNKRHIQYAPASSLPKLLLPAPRKPISAIRWRRVLFSNAPRSRLPASAN